MSIDTGGQAFPQCSYNMKGGYDITGGATLRDYFAAKAMQAYCNRADWTDDTSQEDTAVIAYAMADEMLKARQ